MCNKANRRQHKFVLFFPAHQPLLESVSSLLNPFMLNVFFFILFGPVHFQNKGYLVRFFYYYFIEIPVFNANSVDPDQTPRSAASDLGLHCLPLSLYGTLGSNGLRYLFLGVSSHCQKYLLQVI